MSWLGEKPFDRRVVDHPLILDGFDGAFRRREIDGVRLELYQNFIDKSLAFDRECEIKESFYASNMASFIGKLIHFCSMKKISFRAMLLGLQQNHIILSEEMELMGESFLDFKDTLLRESKSFRLDYRKVIDSLIFAGHLSKEFRQLGQGGRRRKRKKKSL